MVNAWRAGYICRQTELHGNKVMLCLCWNSRRVVHVEVLKPGQTVTSEVNSLQLTRKQDALCRQGVDTTCINLLHDNARLHIAKVVQQKMEKCGWTVSPHPSCSLDIFPSDYYIFRSVQRALARKKTATKSGFACPTSSIRGQIISLKKEPFFPCRLEKDC